MRADARDQRPCDAAAHCVAEYLFARDDPIAADITIVLGMTRWHRPVERALELDRHGLAGLLVFTGGWNSAAGVVEAEAMARSALSRGIASNRLLVEPRATNTAENLSRALEAIRASGHPVDGVALNLVAVAWHARRVLLTARRLLPESIRLGLATYPSLHFSACDWHRSATGRRSVLGELERIERYFGPVAPAEVREAQALLIAATGECA